MQPLVRLLLQNRTPAGSIHPVARPSKKRQTHLFSLTRTYLVAAVAAFMAVAVADAETDALRSATEAMQSKENYGYGRTGSAVDLGLSVMWSDHNVGADAAQQVGRLFGYGDVEGNETSNDLRKYAKGDVAGTERDPAYVYWGGGWRMPTQSEFEELCDRCRWVWEKRAGVAGFRVVGAGGRSIFLPVTGMKSNGSLQFQGERGYYWSGENSVAGSGYAPVLFFYKGGKLIKSYKKAYGFAIRPVREDY